MKSLTIPLIHSIWQGAVIAVALWISLRFARASRTRYALASAALLLMFVAPLLMWRPEPAVAPVDVRPQGPVIRMYGVQLRQDPVEQLAWIPMAWALGVGLFSIRLARAAWATSELRRGARPVENCWTQIVDRAVMVAESAAVRVPSQIGVWRPLILLPLGMLAQMPAAQVEAILAHEMAHIRRHDYLVNLFQVIAETLMFYHPAVWWASKVMRREREHCADELALELVGDRRAYAEALVSLETARAAGFAAAANGGELKARIERVLGEGPARRGSVMPAVAVVALVLGWAAMGQSQPAPAATRPQVKAAEATENQERVAELQAEVERLRLQVKTLQAVREDAAVPVEKLRRADADRMAAEQRRLEEELRLQQKAFQAQTAETDRRAAEQRRLEEVLRLQQKAFQAAATEVEKLRRVQAAEADRMAADQRRLEEESRLRQKAFQAAVDQHEDLRSYAEALRANEKNLGRQMAEARRVAEALAGPMQADAEKERQRRVEYADKKWSSGGKRGSETARGRVYVELGPPDELEVYEDKSEAWRYRATGRIVRFDAAGNRKE